MVKKKITPLNYGARVFRPIYREELEAIEKVMKEEMKLSDYKVTTTQSVCESVTEIPEDEELTTLEFQGYNPFIELRIFRKYVLLYIENNEIKSRGAFISIKKILEPVTKPRLHGYIDSSGWLIITIGAALLLTINIELPTWLSIVKLVAFFFIMLQAPFVLIAAARNLYALLTGSKVINRYRTSQPNFFVRNKDELIIVLISALVTAVVTVLLTLLFLR